jgi:hypothetical protein
MLNNHIISVPNPKGLDSFSLTTVILRDQVRAKIYVLLATLTARYGLSCAGLN